VADAAEARRAQAVRRSEPDGTRGTRATPNTSEPIARAAATTQPRVCPRRCSRRSVAIVSNFEGATLGATTPSTPLASCSSTLAKLARRLASTAAVWTLPRKTRVTQLSRGGDFRRDAGCNPAPPVLRTSPKQVVADCHLADEDVERSSDATPEEAFERGREGEKRR
jgi:hypothetical protein